MTETPRTDEFLIFLATGVHPDQIPHSWIQPLGELARQLEADLIATQKERDETYNDYLLERKRAALQLEEADKCRARAEKAEQALAEARVVKVCCQKFDTCEERCLPLVDHLRKALALRGEPVASSACPMDGIDMPHGHTVEAVAAYLRLERDRFLLPEHRDAIAVEVRGCPDGWVLLPLKMTAEMIRAVDETLLRSGEGNEEHVQRHFNSLVRAAPKPLYAAPISGERAAIYTKEDVEAMCAMAIEAHKRAAAVSGEPGVHAWVPANELVKWPHCCECGIIQRKDGLNKPCKGRAEISLRAVSGERVREACAKVRIYDTGAPRGERRLWVVEMNGAVIFETFKRADAEKLRDAIDRALPLAAQPGGEKDDVTLIQRLEFIANAPCEVIEEEITQVCDLAADRLRSVAALPERKKI